MSAMSGHSVGVSVVIPVFDEARRIRSAVAGVVSALEDRVESFEILCVDDGSTDATAAEAGALAAQDTRIRLLRLPRHLGKGAAVRAGVLAAHGETIFYLDADLSTPPGAILASLPLLRNGVDVVRASRHCAGARVRVPQGWLRRWLGRGFLALARPIADVPATDLTCGFKGFRRDAARAVFARCRQDGWVFDVEVALLARRLGYRCHELPVTWTNDNDSRVRVPGAVVECLVGLARVAWSERRRQQRSEGA